MSYLHLGAAPGPIAPGLIRSGVKQAFEEALKAIVPDEQGRLIFDEGIIESVTSAPVPPIVQDDTFSPVEPVSGEFPGSKQPDDPQITGKASSILPLLAIGTLFLVSR